MGLFGQARRSWSVQNEATRHSVCSVSLTPVWAPVLLQACRRVGLSVQMCGMQGRDDIGRPLLQRAYDIQKKALGPNHPDVLAIADVLNSEDD